MEKLNRFTRSNNPTISEKNTILQTMRAFFKFNWLTSPFGVLIITIGGIALAEVIAMIIIYFVRFLPYPSQVLLDALIMTVIIAPLLYNLSFRPILLDLRRRKRSESIAQARLRLIQFAHSNALDKLLQYTLDEIEGLTSSNIGFFHFLDDDEKIISLQAWSSNTTQHMCTAEGKGSHYDLDRAGVWADAVRLRKPVIHNQYASLAGRKGLPEGHAAVMREMVTPVIRNGKVKAILGVGNKPGDYDSDDLELVSTLADFVWDIVLAKKSEDELRQSEEKFRTLVDWTYDWEMWVDPSRKMVYTSPSCERITGYPPEAFMADPALLWHIVHPEDQALYQAHANLLRDQVNEVVDLEFRIIARDGSVHWIEHLCRPLFAPDGTHLGRRVTNRDVTDRKLAEKKIADQARYEAALTGTLRTIQGDIARDLHDTLGQNIGFLRMNLDDLAAREIDHPDLVNDRIQAMLQAANESYELIRSMLAMLQMGDPHDLASMFSHYGRQISERSALQVSIESQGHQTALPPLTIRQLFYIYREALSNIEKHAQAGCVFVRFSWGMNSIKLEIADDGVGFDDERLQANGHYGLKFMRERAELLNGSFAVRTSPQHGTIITVEVPFC